MEDRINLPEDLLFDDSFQDYVLKKDPASTRKWNRWIKENPEYKEDFNRAKQILLSIKIKGYDFSKEKFEHDLAKFKKAISKQPPQSPQVLSLQSFFGRVAAAVIILIATGGLFYLISFQGIVQPGDQANANEIISKTSPKGTKTLIALSDGTKVKLNSGSTLEYAEMFGEQRVVRLKGEAFFEVTKDSIHPFIIYSNNLEVKVLGTSFNVKAYEEDEVVEVAVATGMVAVKEKNSQSVSSVFLTPSEKAIYSKKLRTIETSGFDADEEFGWRNGILVFKNAEFEEIIKDLKRWYGTEIEVSKDLNIQKGYTGKFRDEALAHVLDGLSFSLGFQYSIEGEKVRIFK